MKYRPYISRIVIAIVLTLVIGVLPHHHHHGELCWMVEQCEGHHHHADEEDRHGCPSEPCNESTCEIQSLRSFIASERSDLSAPLPLAAIQAEEILQTIPFIDILDDKVSENDNFVTLLFSSGNGLRGPPFC